MAAHAPERPRSYIPTLDGWRAVAVLGVTLFHDTLFVPPVHDSRAWWLLRYGRYGVDVFFAISGLLITSRLVDELRANGDVSLRAFYVRRAFRILPAALVFLALTGVVLQLDPGPYLTRPLEWIACALFFRNYVRGSLITEHLWSLSVEEHFYALWPLVFLLLARSRRPWLVLLGPLAIIVWRSLVCFHVVPDPIDANYVFRTDFRLDALLWGAAAGLALRSPSVLALLERFATRIVFVVALGAFAAGELIPFGIAATVQAITAPILLVCTILRPGWLLSRLLETSVMRWIGRLSYGLYLFQQILGAWSLGGTYGIFLVLPVACASYYLIERPLLALGHDIAARRRTPGFGRRVALAVGVAATLGPLVVFAALRARLEGARVVVYGDADFRGPQAELGLGPHSLVAKDSPFPNDAVSSIRVGYGARALLCVDVEDDRAAGECWTLGPGAWYRWLDDKNDKISFIEVTRAE